MRELSCDVLVAGAGPAGIAAACCAAEAGKRVIVVDDNPAAGGQIWRGQPTAQARRWINRLSRGPARLLGESRIVQRLDEDLVLADGDPPRLIRSGVYAIADLRFSTSSFLGRGPGFRRRRSRPNCRSSNSTIFSSASGRPVWVCRPDLQGMLPRVLHQ